MTLFRRRNLLLRVPRWTPAESVALRVNGETVPVRMLGDCALIPAAPGPAEVALSYDLPQRQVVEPTDGVAYRFTWRGDEIVGISPNADFLTFYPTGPDAAAARTPHTE